MGDLRRLDDLKPRGTRVLVRVDFNVPIANGRVTSDRRILQALPTIRWLREQGAELVLISHLGRPSGTGYEAEFSLEPVAVRLAELLGEAVHLGPREVIGAAALTASHALPITLLENVRFLAGETISDKASKNPDKKLTAAQQATLDAVVAGLAELGDHYVNDAFGTCHRRHASMYGLPLAIAARGGQAVAGRLVEKEVRYLHQALESPKRPFIAVLGGAKVSDKIALIDRLLPKVDRILIGGAMAYTLLAARGGRIGRSRVELAHIEAMRALLARAGEKIGLPVDHVVTQDLASGAGQVVSSADIPDDLLGVDIGPATRAAFAAEIESAGTVVWNGPMGVFETEAFAAGTRDIAEALVRATGHGAMTIVGGGDSASAVEQFGLEEGFSHISTGGGASLEYLEGREMPPLSVLTAG